MPLTIKVWASSIKGLIGSNTWFLPIIWYIRERNIRLFIRVLVIEIVGIEAIEVARKLLIEIK